MYIDSTHFNCELDTFAEVPAGSVFWCNDNFYMRLYKTYEIEDLSYNAIQLDTGRLAYFSDNVPITFVSAELIVENA